MWILKALTALFGLFGRGRSPAALLNLTVPRSGYKVHRDIAYGPGARQKLDLYVPDAAEGPAPIVLFFYGGAFRAGRKSEYRVVGQALASKGIIVAVADYRIYPEARFPDFLEDGANAAAKVHELAAHYGGDPSRIFLAGHSAGAYIAVMLACNPAYLHDAKADLSLNSGRDRHCRALSRSADRGFDHARNFPRARAGRDASPPFHRRQKAAHADSGGRR